jgi:Bacterial SH3 domain
VEPVGRPLPPLPRPVVAAGIGAALLGVALPVTLWPNAGSDPAPQALAPADEGRRDAVTDALRTAGAFRAEERTSRDRTDSPRRAAPVEQTRAHERAKAVPAVVGQLWVTTDVNIRSSPSAGHDRIGSLEAGARANITGVTKTGWTQVVTDGRTGWVSSAYLSRSKPKPPPQPPSAGVSKASCSISPSIESHLTSNARSVYRAVCAAYGGSVSSFGGYRVGDPGDHGSGRAVDIMVSGQPGRDIARYVQSHSREFHVTYVIYEQKIWLAGNPTSQWKPMEDRGSRTANHYDHVHVSVS